MMAIKLSGCSAIGMASFSNSAALRLAGAAGGGTPFSAGAEEADAGGAGVAVAGAAEVAAGAAGVAVAGGVDPVAAGGVWLLATPAPTTATAKAARAERRQPFIYAIPTLQTF